MFERMAFVAANGIFRNILAKKELAQLPVSAFPSFSPLLT
jgi:hypothetical protein